MNLTELSLPLTSSRKGMNFGLLGVLIFSFTLPATRLAVASLDPIIIGLGRGLIASCFAAPLLYFTHQPRPTPFQMRGIALVVVGVVIGFPTLSAWAMQYVPASHGAVVLGLLPLATALAGCFRAGERPSVSFWCAALIGSFAVVAFAFSSGGGSFHMADLALLAAIIFAALGYAEGARLAREIGGWQVIAWALVFAFPLLLAPVSITIYSNGITATWSAWFGFAYVSIFSAFLGFFAWYHGLALGGVARVSQLQLLQPFFTFAFASLFLGERLTNVAVAAMSCVTLSIFFSHRSKVGIRHVGLKEVELDPL